MVTFTIAVILFFITPGPAVLSVAGVGSAFGSGPGIKYIAGLWVGTNLVAIVIVSGLAATALENRNIQLIFLTMSLLYLSFLAGTSSMMIKDDIKLQPQVDKGKPKDFTNNKSKSLRCWHSAFYGISHSYK